AAARPRRPGAAAGAPARRFVVGQRDGGRAGASVAHRSIVLWRAPGDRPGDAEAVRLAIGARVRGLRGGGAAHRGLGGAGWPLSALAAARARAPVRRLLPRIGRTHGAALRGLSAP